MRQIWNQYYDDAAGVILVVDAADHRRLNEAMAVAVAVLRSSRLEGAPLLLLANKNDKVGAIDIHMLQTRLLDSLREDGVRGLPSSAPAPAAAAAGAGAGAGVSGSKGGGSHVPIACTELLGHAVTIASVSALACDGVREAVEAFVPAVRDRAAAQKAKAPRGSS